MYVRREKGFDCSSSLLALVDTTISSFSPLLLYSLRLFFFCNHNQDLTPANSRKFAAEFVATTLFVWVGCSTAVSSQAMLAFDPNATNDNTFLVAVSLAFGIAIAVLAYTIAPISGGHSELEVEKACG